MKAALDLMLFLVSGLALAGGTVAGVAMAACVLTGAGWWWLRRGRR
ncbi:hypothetical protein ACFOD9_03430 [Novosphingobium bradum]|uniref:Uncharacterized protein n=1 Tax=Novosphingobium bradum TaxID=1737444 RepID=A0ABV7IKT7_9SPHN